MIMTKTMMQFCLGSLQFVYLDGSDGSPHFVAPVISEPETMWEWYIVNYQHYQMQFTLSPKNEKIHGVQKDRLD